MAGHSRWANIKQKKAKSDAARGKLWSKCARAVIVAAKNGGSDPVMNLTLRQAIDEAKAANLPKDTIEKAIKKGSGELGAESYDPVAYEGYGPSGVAIMVEGLTDNRTRTAPEIKRIFEKGGGNMGATGCVGYMFEPRGLIAIAKAGADEDTVMAAALDAGALDVLDADEVWEVVTEPTSFTKVRDALEAAKLKPQSAQLTRIPTTSVTLDLEVAKRVLALVETLEDHDDVQKVYANFEIPAEVMAALE